MTACNSVIRSGRASNVDSKIKDIRWVWVLILGWTLVAF